MKFQSEYKNLLSIKYIWKPFRAQCVKSLPFSFPLFLHCSLHGLYIIVFNSIKQLVMPNGGMELNSTLIQVIAWCLTTPSQNLNIVDFMNSGIPWYAPGASELIQISEFLHFCYCMVFFIIKESYMPMAKCKTAVTPLLTHWSYCSFALNHCCKTKKIIQLTKHMLIKPISCFVDIYKISLLYEMEKCYSAINIHVLWNFHNFSQNIFTTNFLFSTVWISYTFQIFNSFWPSDKTWF